ncbi:MAG: DNA methyltransferase [Allosphingosinicella sp.]
MSEPTINALRKRAARLRAGAEQREDERRVWLAVTRGELILPILQLVAAGAAAPRDLYDEVCRLVGVDSRVREAVATYKGRPSRLFDREVRWAMQDAKRHGLLFTEGRDRWRVTDAGNEALGRVRPGVRLVIFRTGLGQAVAALAQEAAAIVDPGSAQVLFTSPLFPLCTPLKSYGTMTPAEWLPWMLEMLEAWMPLMREDGCLAVHLGSAVYYRGVPAISSYRERFVCAAVDELGLYRMPDLYWEQPSRLANIQWGAKAGMHPRPTVDPIYIFSPSPRPFMAAGDMRTDRGRPGRQGAAGQRPSGLSFGADSFATTMTRFPSALITAGNSSGAGRWRDRMREEGITAHPCPMPVAVPRYAIQMLSRPGDLVLDPFFGSGATGAAAEELGRRWVGVDHHRLLLEGAACRPQFENAHGFERLAA